MAYSIDFRRKVIEYKDKGHTHAEVREVFGIYPSTLSEWRKLLEEKGTLEAQYPATREIKINMEKLERLIEEKPGAYLHELAKEFNCTKQAIFYAQERLGITYKKKRSHTQKSQEKKD